MDTWGDAWLTAAIQNALANEPGLEGTHIQVETHQGIVTLRGFVHRHGQLQRANYVARNFGGVLDLENDLQVTP